VNNAICSRHDIAEIQLKLALNTNQSTNQCSLYSDFIHNHHILITRLWNIAVLNNRLILSYKGFSKDINTLLKSIVSVAYR